MKTWKLSDKLAFWGIVVSVISVILGLLFQGPCRTLGLLCGEPQFEYIYEGAFDQTNPEYEVAFPLAWADNKNSNVHIRVHADYNGSEYDGITYIKLRQADGNVITVGQWNDFSSESEKQQDIPLRFSDLFEYSGLRSNIANYDISTGSPTLVSGQFSIYVENAGRVIPGSEQTVTVYNTPWFHRAYLDQYEMSPGEKIKAYIEIINFGAEADFSVTTCPYRIATLSYQVDPAQVTPYEESGFWPTRPGNLQIVCDKEVRTLLHLKKDEKQTITVNLPDNSTAEQGYYDFMVFVVKKLPVVNYGTSNWEADWYSRDGRQHAAYIVIGK